MADVQVPTRAEAIEILDRGRSRVLALLDGVPEAAVVERGRIGGGAWSAKDLLAHLAFWERNAVQAMGAWAKGEVAHVDRMLRDPGQDAINEAAVEASFALSWGQVFQVADQVHAELRTALEGCTDAAWGQPAASRGKGSMGERVGVILVGRGDDLFDHASAHVKDLEVFRSDVGV